MDKEFFMEVILPIIKELILPAAVATALVLAFDKPLTRIADIVLMWFGIAYLLQKYRGRTRK